MTQKKTHYYNKWEIMDDSFLYLKKNLKAYISIYIFRLFRWNKTTQIKNIHWLGT